MPTDTEADLHDAYAPAMFDVADIDHKLTLAERFTVVPFSVLDTRGGWWQERKRLWGSQGLKSEVGRSARAFAEKAGSDEVSQKILALTNGQSIFDPVLCEMAYRWWVPVGGSVLDPFAGGSVRGVVAGVLGRQYTGVDLSADQVNANREQMAGFVDRKLIKPGHEPSWIVGDSAEVLKDHADLDPEGYDFVWSCPPYYDLEHYSEDPADLSNMSWPEFLAGYEWIIDRAVNRLKPDRFAGFVVGEIRDKRTGMYRNLVGETIRAFTEAGAEYYNELVIVNAVGTLALRTAKQFDATRKIGKTHQNLLLFVKGDPKKAAAACDPRILEAIQTNWDEPEDDA